MVVFGGTTTPILFQWLVNRDVLVGTPSFHGIMIPIFTSLLLVLVYIHFRGFICFMNKIERIILVRARPILLPNIIKKSSPKLELKMLLFYFLFLIFTFFIFKFIAHLSYLESLYSVLCFL
ncbi:hypothetical protein CY35_04G122000, partial [Sphagnum magellanicum]